MSITVIPRKEDEGKEFLALFYAFLIKTLLKWDQYKDLTAQSLNWEEFENPMF